MIQEEDNSMDDELKLGLVGVMLLGYAYILYYLAFRHDTMLSKVDKDYS